MEIEEHESRRPGAALLGELIDIVHGLVGIGEQGQGVRESMGREDPANERHIGRVIFDRDNREWRRWWSIHDRLPSSHTRHERSQRVFTHLKKGCHSEGAMAKIVQRKICRCSPLEKSMSIRGRYRQVALPLTPVEVTHGARAACSFSPWLASTACVTTHRPLCCQPSPGLWPGKPVARVHQPARCPPLEAHTR